MNARPLLCLVTSLGLAGLGGCVDGTRGKAPLDRAPELGEPETYRPARVGRPELESASQLGGAAELGDPPLLTPPGVIAGCEDIAAQSAHCMVLADDALVMIGLDTFAACEGPRPEVTPHRSGSLGWLSDGVYLCAAAEGGPVVTRVSIADGFAERSAMPCDAVTDHDGGLLALPGTGERLDFWPTFDEVMGGQVPFTLDIEHHGTRIGTSATTAVFAEREAVEVQVTDLLVRESRRVPLEGFSGEVFAIDATEDGRLLVVGAAGLYELDAETGARVGFHELPDVGRIHGVSCRGR